MKLKLKRIDHNDIGMIMLLNLPKEIREKNNVVNIKNKIDRGDSIFYDLEHTEGLNIFTEMNLEQIDKFVNFYEIDDNLPKEIKKILNKILILKEAFITEYPKTMFDIELGKGAIRKNLNNEPVIFNIFHNIENVNN